MRKISGNSHIRYAVDDDMIGTTIPANLFSHDGRPGLERRGSGGSQIDPTLNFTVENGHALPPDTEAAWTGELHVDPGGLYWVYLQALGANAHLYIDGKRVAITGVFQGDVHGDIVQANQDNVIPTTDGLDNVRRQLDLSAGAHSIKVHISPDTSHSPVQVRLNWYSPEQRKADHQAAIEAARCATVAVAFGGAAASAAILVGPRSRMEACRRAADDQHRHLIL